MRGDAWRAAIDLSAEKKGCTERRLRCHRSCQHLRNLDASRRGSAHRSGYRGDIAFVTIDSEHGSTVRVAMGGTATPHTRVRPVRELALRDEVGFGRLEDERIRPGRRRHALTLGNAPDEACCL